MKISCLPVSLSKAIFQGEMDVLEWAKMAKSIGYDGFDLNIMFLRHRTPAYLASIQEAFSQLDIPPVMMCTAPDFTHPDPKQRQREVDYFIADIAVANQLGVPYLRILAGQTHPETELEDGIQYVLDCFRKVDVAAKNYGVTLVYEDHAKPVAWDQVDFSYPPEIFLRICEGMRDTGIRVNFDTGNIIAFGEEPMEILPKVLDLVETIHVSDMAEKGRFSPTTIGTGIVPNEEIFSYLKKMGWDGWLCIEEASGQGRKGIEIAHQFVKTAWAKT